MKYRELLTHSVHRGIENELVTFLVNGKINSEELFLIDENGFFRTKVGLTVRMDQLTDECLLCFYREGYVYLDENLMDSDTYIEAKNYLDSLSKDKLNRCLITLPDNSEGLIVLTTENFNGIRLDIASKSPSVILDINEVKELHKALGMFIHWREVHDC